MKKILTLIFLLYTINFSVNATQSISYNIKIFPNNNQEEIKKQDNAGVFWINFTIAAIGTYSIYGIGAGIVAVGITYFVVNGDKKAMKKAILGCVLGMLAGGLVRLLTLI